ncbi:MAG: type II toxin-antitoxin system PemK/MazF family toxin [Pyrinomonadaceae bacterium]
MAAPGAVVIVDFPGATGIKRRPAIIVSTATYHAARPDVILGVITSQTAKAIAPTDYLLQDWTVAGLHSPSAFRAFLSTLPATSVISTIGQLSDRDWQEIKARLRIALAVT